MKEVRSRTYASRWIWAYVLWAGAFALGAAVAPGFGPFAALGFLFFGTEEGYVEGLALVGDKTILSLREAVYNSKRIQVSGEPDKPVWPLVPAGKDPIHIFHKGKPKRLFVCLREFPEFAIPWERMPKAMVEWREETRRLAMREDPKTKQRYIEATVFQRRLLDFKLSDANRTMLATAFSGDMTAEDTGLVFQGRLQEGLMRRVLDNWPIVVGALVFGLLEGWQLADTILPDLGSNKWFGLLLPLAMIGMVILLALRSD